jgi:dipeptidase E
MGGGGFSEDPDNPLLDDYILSLANSPDPRVCFVPTASGDAAAYIVKFYAAFTKKQCRPTHLALLQDSPRDLEKFVLSQDIIYVGGGNTATMLAAWRVMGLELILKEAWFRGIILCGISAGAICWFESGPTDSLGLGALTPLLDGLGLISGSHCPHYDSDPTRRPAYKRFIEAGLLPPGFAADDGAALCFRGTEFVEAVASRPGARGWRVEKTASGVVETPLPTRQLTPSVPRGSFLAN